MGESRTGCDGCYHLADSTGSVGDFAQMAASHPGGTATTSQTGTFRFGTVVTTATGGGGGGGERAQTPKPAPPVKTGITAIETLLQNLLPVSPAQCIRIGLRWCVSRVANQVMSCTECGISIYVEGMEGGEGGTRICYDFFSRDSGSSPGGKRRLIWGGGSAARISNGTGPQDPGGGEAQLTTSRDMDVA